MVVTLHACDTATDAALYKAVLWDAKVILSVPCCQHELNRQIKCQPLSAVFQYGLLKERIAALVTDGMRAELLNASGYKTQVMEFIDMEHTPKNIPVSYTHLDVYKRQGDICTFNPGHVVLKNFFCIGNGYGNDRTASFFCDFKAAFLERNHFIAGAAGSFWEYPYRCSGFNKVNTL